MSTRIIGIDFGTSTTVVRIHNIGRENKIDTLLVEGRSTIPTVAFKDESGHLFYGYDAIAKINAKAKGDPIRNFKMDLICKDEEVVRTASKLVDGFVSYLYKKYQEAEHQNQFDEATDVMVYMSHPVKWTSEARSIMKRSVVKAGFCSENKVFLKDEPTAAVLAVIHEKESELMETGLLFDGREYKAMMIDMGAGTTDIVLFTYKINKGKLELNNLFPYPTVGNPGLCGGREIDRLFVNDCAEYLSRMQGAAQKLISRSVRRFENRVTSWKEDEVSSYLRAGHDVPEIEEISDFRDLLGELGLIDELHGSKYILNRDKFESITNNHWQSWACLINDVFTEVSKPDYCKLQCPKKPQDVQLLVLTGGHSQWYITRDYLCGKMVLDLPPVDFSQIQANPKRMILSTSPQETVAVGLCYLNDDVVSVMPTSNDVSISFYCQGKHMGTMDLLKKGIPLPYSKKDISVSNKIKCDFIRTKEIVVTYKIVTDNVITTTKSVSISTDGFFKALLKIILYAIGIAIVDIPLILLTIITDGFDAVDPVVLDDILNHEEEIKLEPDIEVSKEGIISISGKIILDDVEATMQKTTI